MKKLLLIFGMFVLSLNLSAQVIVYVEEPASVEGSLEFTWSENWGADLLNPINSIRGELIFVTDGTAADSLGCNQLTNANAFSTTVSGITLTSSGSGYTTANGVATTTTGSGTGLTVNIVAAPIGSVTAFNLATLDGGTGYDNLVNVPTSSNGNGTGLTVDITTEDGVITAVQINNPGTGYAPGDLISIEEGNLDATIEVSTITNGEILSVTIANAGNGYAQDDIITIAGGTTAATATISDVNGKIAVVYRGDCQFGRKALNAQLAGAIGVIIINNVPGGPVGMAAGDVGNDVTIPVVMITNTAGAQLRNAILQGGVVAFIGNKTSLFDFDLGIFQADILRPFSGATNRELAQNQGDYTYKVGARVTNYGSQAQTGVTLSATIRLGNQTLYNNTSSAFNINPGENLFVLLPDANFAHTNNGHYVLTYTVNSPNQDAFPSDNEAVASVYMNDTLFTYARVDRTTNTINNIAGYRSTTATNNFDICLVFRDANASRTKVRGLWFAASTAPDNTLEGEFMQTRIMKWSDPFVDLDDPALDVQQMETLAEGTYDYFENIPNQMVYVPFDEAIQLENNQRYVACVRTISQNVFLGFDAGIDYEQNVAEYNQPIWLIQSNNTYGLNGFGTDLAPSISLDLVELSVGVNEQANAPEITPYPNPAQNFVMIPFSNEKKGIADLQVYDITGKMVLSERVDVTHNNIKSLGTNQLENGNYLFRVVYADGSSTSFKVMISK